MDFFDIDLINIKVPMASIELRWPRNGRTLGLKFKETLLE
jgi:hypothetical protein